MSIDSVHTQHQCANFNNNCIVAGLVLTIMSVAGSSLAKLGEWA